MRLHRGHRRSTSKDSTCTDDSKISEDGRSDTSLSNDDNTQEVDADQGNVLSHIISHLRPGADLSRIDDPVERFVAVVKFYLSGWHIRPAGVKKPLNPILGEIFTCYWDVADGKRAYYISEQTSHHPPKSSYFYIAPDYHVRVDGTLKPRSRFLGNSAASMMEGVAFLSLLNRGQDPSKGERYLLTQPNMYARGILFGKMKYELGDQSFVRCPELDLVAEVDFKTKGWVSGTYNAIGGVIKHESTGEVLYELSGLWNEEMYITDLGGADKTGQQEMFFDGRKSKPSPHHKNHEVATDEKTLIEDRQRQEAALRAADDVEWTPRLFRRVRGGPGGSEEGEEDLEWIINSHINHQLPPEAIAEHVMSIYPIIHGQRPNPSHVIPARTPDVRPTSTEDYVSAHAPQQGGDLIDLGPGNGAAVSANGVSASGVEG
ncbi:unnamed protein product [Parascedosporium putredinis]|uniref:Oxysterol-binding protein n=1 Tax=Parascedosporium putredinis TaxID=1442378 RepID=A0A9P1H6R8_9PEZI|nr:unnamed protein product [Parascedosporium putredinis]CAI7998253.1 unnamed protein product [Parascedosporium putredinis]